MSVLTIRAIAEQDTEVFRDVEVDSTHNFESLHNVLKEAYEFTDNELSSFYLSDEEWNKGEEIVLADLGEADEPPLIMKDTFIESQLFMNGQRLFFVYDFLVCKTFFLEVIDIKEADPEVTYPRVTRVVGKTPKYDDPLLGLSADDFLGDEYSEDESEFKMESLDDDSVFNDDMFEDFNDFEDYQ